MQDSGRDEPSGSSFESIGPRQVENAVVAAIPILEAPAQLILRRARLESHEGVREVVVDVVVLGREVVALGLSFLAHECGVFLRLVHVVRDRSHVVEEFRVDRPSVIFAKDGRADEFVSLFGDGVLEEEFFSFEEAETEPFVPNASFVGGFGGAGEPAFIDASTISTECV